MMSRPGESKIEMAAAWLCFFSPTGAELMYRLKA